MRNRVIRIELCPFQLTILLLPFANQLGSALLYIRIWFDSLRPINNLSVKQGRGFLGWTSTNLGYMCLVQGPQRSDTGEARTRGPSVSSQALYHWATALPIHPGHHMGKWQKYKKTSHTRAAKRISALSQWPQGCNEQTRKHDKQATGSKNIFTGGLKLVLRYQPHPYFRCRSWQIDVWFAWKIPNLSMYHILVNTNWDINGDKTKIRTQQYIQMNTGV